MDEEKKRPEPPKDENGNPLPAPDGHRPPPPHDGKRPPEPPKDENGNPINYQINFTYDDNADTITINFQFTDENDAVITFPMVFQRDAVVA